MHTVLAKYRNLKRRINRLRHRAAEHRAALRLVRCATTDDINSALEVVYARHNVPIDFPGSTHKRGQWMPGEIKMFEQVLQMRERHAQQIERMAALRASVDTEGAPGGMGARHGKGLFTE